MKQIDKIGGHPQIFHEFMLAFNSQLSTNDFLWTYAALNVKNPSLQISLTEKDKVSLGCKKKELYVALQGTEYIELLKKIIVNIRIENFAFDVFRSEMSESIIVFYNQLINHSKKNFDLIQNDQDQSFIINGDKVFLKVIENALHQLHNEILLHLDDFLRYQREYKPLIDLIEKNEDSKGLLINRKVTSPFSYFVIAFLCENLNFQINTK